MLILKKKGTVNFRNLYFGTFFTSGDKGLIFELSRFFFGENVKKQWPKRFPEFFSQKHLHLKLCSKAEL